MEPERPSSHSPSLENSHPELCASATLHIAAVAQKNTHESTAIIRRGVLRQSHLPCLGHTYVFQLQHGRVGVRYVFQPRAPSSSSRRGHAGGVGNSSNRSQINGFSAICL